MTKDINFNGSVFSVTLNKEEDLVIVIGKHFGGMSLRNCIGFRGMLDEISEKFGINVEKLKHINFIGKDNEGKFTYFNDSNNWYKFNGIKIDY